MNSEKFDKVVLDLLYDELDELTRASAMRHIEQSARARVTYSELRATRMVGALPLVEPPDGLAERIIAAEHRARAELPLRQRFGRLVSIIAGYTMRPQLAMAALLLVTFGYSLIFLRARPGERDQVLVTERGVPEVEGEAVTIVPAPERRPARESAREVQAHGVVLPERPQHAAGASPDEEAPAARAASRDALALAPRARGDVAALGAEASGVGIGSAGAGAPAEAETPGSSPYARGMIAFHERRYTEATRHFDDVVAAGGSNAPSAALFAARAAHLGSGCGAALPRFERIEARYPGTGVAHEAKWLAAECYRSDGRLDDATRAYRQLASVEGYGEKARRALSALNAAAHDVATGAARAGSAAKAAPAQAAPPPPAEPADESP